MEKVLARSSVTSFLVAELMGVGPGSLPGLADC
jgi:hypothetical protein